MTAHSKDARIAAAMAIVALPQFEGERVIIFARSNWVDALAAAARIAGITGVRVLTGEQDDVSRMAAITEFNTKAARVLICTDRISRGLDFPDVGLVIHSALPPPSPTSVETFVHRSGRAARVGRNGVTVAIVSRDAGSEDAAMLEMIRSTVHCEFAPLHLGSAAPVSDVPATTSKKSAKAAPKAVVAAVPKVECSLRLRKGANVTKTARAVVEAALEPAARATAEFAASEDPLSCTFRLAADHVAAAKKALWKYGLCVDGM
jgi:superfamily II DNA/RNA helicase